MHNRASLSGRKDGSNGRWDSELGRAVQMLCSSQNERRIQPSPGLSEIFEGGEMSIQATYKGVEIKMEIHQFPDGWKCDYTLIKHPAGTQIIHHGDIEYATEDLAKEHALRDARDAIDRDL